MHLLDVNILINAFRAESKEQEATRGYLTALLGSGAPFALAPDIVVSFLRLVTNPRIFPNPSTLDEALLFARSLHGAMGALLVVPGPRHFGLFETACRAARAIGPSVPDAHLAALSIEYSLTLVTEDAGFVRFPGLTWMKPGDHAPVTNPQPRRTPP